MARAGRTGTAYSLVSPDELAFVIDLHLFLGRSLNLVRSGKKYGSECCRLRPTTELVLCCPFKLNNTVGSDMGCAVGVV